MNLQDIVISPSEMSFERGQLGSIISNEMMRNSVAIFFCSDERGGGKTAAQKDFSQLRTEFYKLSKGEFQFRICDLGDLISGKTAADTHYILEELAFTCHQNSIIPIVVGGSSDLAFPLFSALNAHQTSVSYTNISNTIAVFGNENGMNERNFLSKILEHKQFIIKDFYLLGYQSHLNENSMVELIENLGFEALKLSEMMGSTEAAEPYLRRADLVTINCDAVESFADAFSNNPQVNGLNKREICAYMKEIGLGENLKSVGIFNFNFESKNQLNYQLLAQMLWYLLEGIHIQKTHPKENKYEQFVVLLEDLEFHFWRNVFTGLWYFGNSENPKEWTPCSPKDYENAKRGFLNKRLK